MARKIGKYLKYLVIFALVTLVFSERACAYTIYDGNISTTQLTYFKDIASNLKPKDDYVFFRSGQYDYTMVVGDIEFNEDMFFLVSDMGKEYKLYQADNGYNSSYDYEVNEINTFTLLTENDLVYSNVGDFPQLIERGSQYETLIIVCLFVIIFLDILKSIFKH